jgi:hypothetical protein
VVTVRTTGKTNGRFQMMYTGKDQTNLFRMKTLLAGLKLEATTGMKLTRGRSAYSIIKSQYGLRGSKVSVYNQFIQIYNAELTRVFQQKDLCL